VLADWRNHSRAGPGPSVQYGIPENHRSSDVSPLNALMKCATAHAAPLEAVARSRPPFALVRCPKCSVSLLAPVEAERTFWDKVVILHGLRRWHDRRGQLRHGGQRVSRHYYDVYRLIESSIGDHAAANRDLAVDCARHARMFFNSPDFDLAHAVPGTLALAPSREMLEPLRRDCAAMSGMVLGRAPLFDA